MSVVGVIPGFVVRPPHLAFCTLIRFLTSNAYSETLQPNVKLATKLQAFILRLLSQKDLHFPTLASILTQLRDQLGEDGLIIGTACKETLSGLCTVPSLTRFIDGLKGDLKASNGMSNLVQRILPQSQLSKCSRHGVCGLFFRNCIVNFEEMSFDQIYNLAIEVEEYCPSMLDQDLKSAYLRDYENLESHVDHLMKEVKRGEIPESLQQDLKSLDSVSKHFPKPALLQHEVAVLEREVTIAFDFLKKFCNQSIFHGGGFLTTEEASFSHKLDRVHTLMLKMSSMHFSFEHIEESMRILEEAFESAKSYQDDGILQSCLVLLLQILIQTSPSVLSSKKLPIDVKEQFQFVDHLLRRCEQKAIEMKTPHIIAFCQICKATLGVKNHIVHNHSANVETVCKMVGDRVRVLKRLRSFVSAGTVASDLKTYVNDENLPGSLPSLFTAALLIFGPSVKNASEAIEASVHQSLPSGILLDALAWKAKGSLAISGALAVIIEAVYSDVSKVSDRAAALGHLAIMEANSKGINHGQRILTYAKGLPSLANEISLKLAEEYIQLGQYLWTALNGHQWSEIKQRSEALASASNHSCVTCMEMQIMGEIQTTRALLTLNRMDAAKEETNRLLQLHDILGLETSKNEIKLLHVDLQDQLGVLDMRVTEFMKDLCQRQNNPMGVVLFCRTLARLEDNSNPLVTQLLHSMLPTVLSEGSLVFQTAFLLILIEFMLPRSGSESTDAQNQILLSLIKKGMDISSRLRHPRFLKELFKRADHLLRREESQDANYRETVILELEYICERNGLTPAEIPSGVFKRETNDAMEVD
eukprot:g5864.t1